MGKTRVFFKKNPLYVSAFRSQLLCKFLLMEVVLSEQSLPIAGNPHLLIGQNLEESSSTKGFVLGCKKIISSLVASGATVGLSLAAKWSKVNSGATATSHV